MDKAGTGKSGAPAAFAPASLRGPRASGEPLRDSQALEVVAREILPAALQGKPAGAPVRVWVVGCASAELAYALAILVLEHVSRGGGAPRDVRVFITDADEARIEKARKGPYPTAIPGVPPERLDRFVARVGEGYRAKKSLRDACLLARHDLVEDPPFCRLDLIAWNEPRGLDELPAASILPTFHYALSPGGHLLFGPGEGDQGLFQAASAQPGIFRRCDTASRPTPALGLGRTLRAPAGSPATGATLERALRSAIVPPTLVVDEHGKVVYLAGEISRFLDLPSGAEPAGILERVRSDLRPNVHAALSAAVQDRREAVVDSVVAAPEGGWREVRVDVRPLRHLDAPSPLFALAFHERDLTADEAASRPPGDPAVLALDHELTITRRHLEATIEDLHRANEELQATNEELQSDRDEQRSIAAELSAINAELTAKLDQRDTAHADLQNVIASSPVAAVLLDREMRIASFTPPATELFRLIPEDVGRPAEDIAGLGLDADLGAAVANVLFELSPSHSEVYRPEGDRWLVRTIRPYRGPEGDVSGVVVVYVDVTELKRAEQALRASEARYRRLADRVPSLVWTADAAGALTYVNDRFSAYTGHPAEQAAGVSLVELVHPDDREGLRAAWTTAVEARAPLEAEARMERVDGAYRWFLVRAQPSLDQQGSVSGWFGASTDVHERKLGEEVLREADRHKDEFLAVLAHELRNPLAPIRNVTYLLQRPTEAMLARVRGIIERQVGHMARMIDDLLDVSRITQGKMVLHRRGIDLSEIVRAAADDQRAAFEERRLSLEVDLPPVPLPMVGDPTRLTQVVANLLYNAAKFTRAGGRVHVALQRLPELGMGQLVVEDTGVGIDPLMLTRIFDAFIQASAGHGGGLGLGLSLVKGLVELHGGTVRAESEGPGCGARFTVDLPVDVHASAADAPSPPPRAPLRVLVIEDNEDSAESMRLLIELLGHEVAVERTGDAALTKARTFRPEIVLCDISLSGPMSGYDVAQALRADPDLAAAHLVAVTGFGSESDRRRTIDAGFEMHLTKPVHPEHLERVVSKLAAG